MAAEWWNPHGKFRPLHRFNPVRLAFLRDRICGHFGRDPEGAQPLADLRLLDIGCGGGLIAEPMARLGATVTGADAGEKNIGRSEEHTSEIQSLMRNSYAVFCLKKKHNTTQMEKVPTH